MSGSLEARIREIEDRTALTELIGRYAECVAQGRGRELAGMFVEDGHFKAGKHGLHGKAALESLFLGMTAGRTLPLVTNIVLTIDGDAARGSATLFAVMPGEKVRSYCGVYDDRFRREGGEWKFVSRDFSFYYDQGGNS